MLLLKYRTGDSGGQAGLRAAGGEVGGDGEGGHFIGQDSLHRVLLFFVNLANIYSDLSGKIQILFF